MPTALSEKELTDQLVHVPAWRRSGKALVRTWKFADFAASMVFVNEIATKAEALDHHPDILIQYNRVTLTLSTHSAGGLTELDFKLAAQIGA